ncbi:MAG: hypothetical protein M0Q88_00825 [Bacilli bacterium]|nr:hypothetical protein [Bacilli bacterium]
MGENKNEIIEKEKNITKEKTNLMNKERKRDIDQEKALLSKIVDAWEWFVKLPRQHPNEHDEFATGIHILQYITGMRILRKEHPELFPIKYFEDDESNEKEE